MYTVIIVMAGRGDRAALGYNKLLYRIGVRPLFLYTLYPFVHDGKCERIVLSVHPDDHAHIERAIEHFYPDAAIHIVMGGATRQVSAYTALKVVQSEWVLIHDGARPFVNAEQITAVYNAAVDTGAALLTCVLRDTIKRIDGFDEVVDTLDRQTIVSAQTPQAFATEAIKKAHEVASEEQFQATDDAQVYAYMFYGKPITALPGSFWNFKITTAEDLAKAAVLLKEVI